MYSMCSQPPKNDFYFYCRLLETRRVAWSLPVGVYPLNENGFLNVAVRIRITRRYQTVSASKSLSSNRKIAVGVLQVSGASICGITPGLLSLAAELPHPSEKSSLTFLWVRDPGLTSLSF